MYVIGEVRHLGIIIVHVNKTSARRQLPVASPTFCFVNKIIY